jgi:hypothetical protein
MVELIAGKKFFTFSNLPISSWTANLLGVEDSTDPSASTPGHKRSLCFPLLRVLDRFVNPENEDEESTDEPFLTKQPESRTPNRYDFPWPTSIPNRECYLRAQRQITITYRKRDPFVPSRIYLRQMIHFRREERFHAYEFLKALKDVRKGIVRGLLSATSWQVTYRSESVL